jgi:hypothetical protein
MSKVSVEIVEVESTRLLVEVKAVRCPGDRQWVYTAMCRVENNRAIYATADWEQDAIDAVIEKVQGKSCW